MVGVRSYSPCLHSVASCYCCELLNVVTKRPPPPVPKFTPPLAYTAAGVVAGSSVVPWVSASVSVIEPCASAEWRQRLCRCRHGRGGRADFIWRSSAASCSCSSTLPSSCTSPSMPPSWSRMPWDRWVLGCWSRDRAVYHHQSCILSRSKGWIDRNGNVGG